MNKLKKAGNFFNPFRKRKQRELKKKDIIIMAILMGIIVLFGIVSSAISGYDWAGVGLEFAKDLILPFFLLLIYFVIKTNKKMR